MSLPNITIPAVNIPFDIPTLLHPALAHFAIAIPVLIVIAEILNLFINGKGVKIISSIFMFLLIAIFFGMYLTGVHDGKVAMDSGFGALDELKEHKLLGIYLFYASIFVFVLKLISLGVNKTAFKIFYILVLIGFLAGVIHQGKEGGELVYKYGANVKISQDNKKITKKEVAAPVTVPETKVKEKEEPKKEAKPTHTESKEQAKEKETKETPVQNTKEQEHQEVKEKVEEKKESILDKTKKEVEGYKEKVTQKAEEATKKESEDQNQTEH